jgi:hypothetical protein
MMAARRWTASAACQAIDMRDYRSDPRAMNVPWAFSPFLDLSDTGVDLGHRRAVAHFRDEGYLVLEEPVVDDATIRRAVEDLAGRDAWRTSGAVAEIARAPSVLDTLGTLYGRRPIPFQTLNFERGTCQRPHSDTIHFHSIPQRFMAGVWVALEDIHPDSGPLVVYPGSHRLPVFDPLDLGIEPGWEHHHEYEDAIEAIIDALALEATALRLSRGQAVIWAANLLHGGSEVRDERRTRLSQASHYYFDDCFYYQPAASEPFVGRLALKEVEEVGTGRPVPNLYRGRPVEEWTRNGAEWGGALRRILGRGRS